MAINGVTYSFERGLTPTEIAKFYAVTREMIRLINLPEAGAEARADAYLDANITDAEADKFDAFYAGAAKIVRQEIATAATSQAKSKASHAQALASAQAHHQVLLTRHAALEKEKAQLDAMYGPSPTAAAKPAVTAAYSSARAKPAAPANDSPPRLPLKGGEGQRPTGPKRPGGCVIS